MPDRLDKNVESDGPLNVSLRAKFLDACIRRVNRDEHNREMRELWICPARLFEPESFQNRHREIQDDYNSFWPARVFQEVHGVDTIVSRLQRPSSVESASHAVAAPTLVSHVQNMRDIPGSPWSKITHHSDSSLSVNVSRECVSHETVSRVFQATSQRPQEPSQQPQPQPHEYFAHPEHRGIHLAFIGRERRKPVRERLFVTLRFGAALVASCVFFITFFVGSSPSLACSDVILWPACRDCPDKSVVSARTMDFGINLYYFAEVVPRNVTWTSSDPGRPNDGKKPKVWTNDFGFVGISGLWALNHDQQKYFEGMNEKGLSVGLLWLEQSSGGFSKPVTGDANLSIQHLAAYVLGKADTVGKVLTLLDPDRTPQDKDFVNVWHEPMHAGKLIPWLPEKWLDIDLPLHLSVHDANGDSIAVEWIKGKPKIYRPDDTKYHRVVTNDPEYSDHVDNVSKFRDLDPSNGMKNPPDNKFGNRDLWLPGDTSSVSRNIRLYKLNRYAKESYSPLIVGKQFPLNWRLQLAMAMIAHSEEVYGESSEGGYMYFHTVFTVIRDHTNKTLYLKGVYNHSYHKVDLTKLDFTAKGKWPWMYIDPDPGDAGYPLQFAQDVTPMLEGTDAPITGALLDPRKFSFSYTLTPKPEDSGKLEGQMFIFRKRVNGEIESWNGTAWVPPRDKATLTMEPAFPTSGTAVLTAKKFEKLFDNAWVSDWTGTQIFAGYGKSQTEMLMQQRYSLVYTVSDPLKITNGGVSPEE